MGLKEPMMGRLEDMQRRESHGTEDQKKAAERRRRGSPR